MKSMSRYLASAIVFTLVLATGHAQGAYLDGGDALSKADATVILDLAFAMDTSGSMEDDQAAITNAMRAIVDGLECPECDVWVQATFYGIAGTWGSGSLFNQSVNGTYVNSSEDNAGAVSDLILNTTGWMIGGATADQDYYKAIVTIGDEGTAYGNPVNEADWIAAKFANQTAIANNVMVFSVTGSPYYTNDQQNMWDVFQALAVGGTKTYGSTTYTLYNTGGSFYKVSADLSSLQADIEDIICTAASGGTTVPEPGTVILFGSGLLGLASIGRKRR